MEQQDVPRAGYKVASSSPILLRRTMDVSSDERKSVKLLVLHLKCSRSGVSTNLRWY